MAKDTEASAPTPEEIAAHQAQYQYPHATEHLAEHLAHEIYYTRWSAVKDSIVGEDIIDRAETLLNVIHNVHGYKTDNDMMHFLHDIEGGHPSETADLTSHETSLILPLAHNLRNKIDADLKPKEDDYIEHRSNSAILRDGLLADIDKATDQPRFPAWEVQQLARHQVESQGRARTLEMERATAKPDDSLTVA